MKINYSKLQEYFSDMLPEPNKVAELLTFHSYEVENFEEKDSDYIFNIDVLPNRAGDSSSEEGVARELSAILNIPLKSDLSIQLRRPTSKLISINVSNREINKLLGSNISTKEIENIFRRLGFEYEVNSDEFTVAVPSNRTDLKIKADIVEEVGRIYGYENIEAVLPEKAEKTPKINKKFYYINKIKNFLVEQGFSEVYTYSFRDSGEVEIEKPFASDKNFLRADLHGGIEKALEQNIKNIPLLDGVDIRIFEIGNVFLKDKEYTSFAMTATVTGDFLNKDGKYIKEIVNKLSEILGVKVEEIEEGDIFEINLDDLINQLPEPPSSYEQLENPPAGGKDVMYSPISAYPFVLRDIAVWVPKDKTSDDALDEIKKEAGELLVNTKLFDEFEKDEKVSYAFNLIFQSQEKTLSDEEVNKVMDSITNALEGNDDWKVR